MFINLTYTKINYNITATYKHWCDYQNFKLARN